MISAKTRYETHNNELLAIIETFKTWKHYWKDLSIRCLYLPTITTSVGLWKWRVWAPDKSARLKNSLVTISELIIIKTRLMELLISCLDTFNKVQRRKRLSVLRISRFCTICNSRWPKYLAFWQVNLARINFFLFTKSSYTERQFFSSYASSRTPSKTK